MRNNIKTEEVLRLRDFLERNQLSHLKGQYILPFRLVEIDRNSFAFQVYEEGTLITLGTVHIQIHEDKAYFRKQLVVPDIDSFGDLTEKTKDMIIACAIIERLFDIDESISDYLMMPDESEKYLTRKIKRFYADTRDAVSEYFNLILMHNLLTKVCKEGKQKQKDRIYLKSCLDRTSRQFEQFNLYSSKMREIHQSVAPTIDLDVFEQTISVNFPNLIEPKNEISVVFRIEKDEHGFYFKHYLTTINADSLSIYSLAHIYAVQTLALLLDVPENPIVDFVNEKTNYKVDLKLTGEYITVPAKKLHTLFGSYILGICDMMEYSKERFSFLGYNEHRDIANLFLYTV